MIRQDAIERELRADVDVLAGLIGERNGRRPSALDAARAHLVGRLAEAGLVATATPYPVAGRTAVNLEVTLPGTDPARPPLVVGAHYDTAWGTPGADDNASAVACLLQIARGLTRYRLRRAVHCVFYDCEEPPHFATPDMGSHHHAAARRRAGQVLHGMICLESLGYWPRRVPAAVQRPRFLRAIDAVLGGRWVAIVSDVPSIAFGLPFVLRFVTAGWFPFVPAAVPDRFAVHRLSDQRSYWDQGYRAVMVTNTAMLRNPNYHRPTDRPDTLDYRRLAKLTRVLTDVVRRTCR